MAESSWVEDSIPNGRTFLYEVSGELYAKVTYQKGMREGWGLYYDKYGNVTDSTFYKNDLIEGFNYSFDKKGALASKIYYFKGLCFGPRFFFNNGDLISYHFFTFEQKETYRHTYNKSNKVQNSDEPFYLNTYLTTSATGDGLGLFAYMAHPPEIDCRYALLERDSSKGHESVLRTFDENDVFIDTSLLLENGKKYYFQAVYKQNESNLPKVIMTLLN